MRFEIKIVLNFLNHKEYNEEIIFKWLPILKHFGPGNYCLLVSIILLYIE